MDELIAQYQSVCSEQAELRSKLLNVNLRKMFIANELTKMVFGKERRAAGPATYADWARKVQCGVASADPTGKTPYPPPVE